MASANDYISKAASYIGISGTDNIFNTWYWGHPCYDANTYPWCACFQSYVGVHDLNMPFEASASAAGVANQGVRVPDSEARKGDWVLFNWDGRQSFGWADHIGVVEWSDISGSGMFGTIEGNTGDAYGGEVARMTRNNNASYATAFFRPPYAVDPPKPKQVPGSAYNNAGLKYQAHVQNIGWCAQVHDGQVAGTVGYAMRLEALKIDPPEGLSLRVKLHIQDIGWTTYDGIKHGSKTVLGTTGKCKRIEAIEIDVLENTTGMKLEYRVHQQNYGRKAWTPAGFPTGCDGQSLRLEAIQMRLV